MIDNVRFNFCELEDIRPGLLELAVGSHGDETITTHLDPLRKLGSTLIATEYARKNAERLATGYRDLVVVLLEPTDKAEDVPYDEMFQQSTALQYVDASLDLAFSGQRCVGNTIILDIRPYRSNRRRTNATGKTRRHTKGFAKLSLYCLPRCSSFVNVNLVESSKI